IHNAFGATQDIAIDALATNVLREDERGLANGLMFGGAYLGQAIGGAGGLFLPAWRPFNTTFFFLAGVTLPRAPLVPLPVPAPQSPRFRAEGSAVVAAGKEIKQFAVDAVRAFLGTRAAFVGLLFAIMPAGAYALGLALQSNLAVELGMSDNAIGQLNLYSSVV